MSWHGSVLDLGTLALVLILFAALLLAGIGILGATQDAMTGFPVTASARLINAMLDTAGIIAGVAGGLTFGNAILSPHPLLESALRSIGITADAPPAAALPRDRRRADAATVSESQRWRLLRAFAGVVADKGLARTTIEDATSAAGVSKKTFYKFFSSKEESIHRCTRSRAAPASSDTKSLITCAAADPRSHGRRRARRR